MKNLKNLLLGIAANYIDLGRRGKNMIYAMVFIGYLAFMFLPLFIMWVIDSYSDNSRAAKRHERRLDKMNYYETEKYFHND